MSDVEALQILCSGPLLWDWKEAPRAIGNYTLWDQDGERLLYAGVAGRDKPPTTPRIWGLQDRLNAHVAGGINRDANQFLTRLFDVLVLPLLREKDLAERLDDPVLYDRRTHTYVRDNVGFRCAPAPTYAVARHREAAIRHGCFGFTPLLNPEKGAFLV